MYLCKKKKQLVPKSNPILKKNIPFTFAPRGEFQFIHLFKEKLPWSLSSSQYLGIGDDAALIPQGKGSKKKWVVSTDSSCEDVHFSLKWTSLPLALQKSLLASLSDLNAMGAVAHHYYFNLGIGLNWTASDLKKLPQALHKISQKYQVSLMGGDTTRTAGPGFFSITVVGELLGQPLLRSNAKPGQTLYITGPLGLSAAGLYLLQNSKTSPAKSPLVKKHLLPSPPMPVGPQLSALPQAVAAIDISDGLSSELWHIANASGCKLMVDYTQIPKSPLLQKGFSREQIQNFILNGGEEYQLLVAANFSDSQYRTLSKKFSLFPIGRVESGKGVYISFSEKKPILLPPAGFEHLT